MELFFALIIMGSAVALYKDNKRLDEQLKILDVDPKEWRVSERKKIQKMDGR